MRSRRSHNLTRMVTHRVVAPGAALAAGLCASACLFSAALPENARRACTSAKDCNADEVCSPLVSTCTARESVAPGPIDDLRVVADSATDDAIVLAWTAPGDDAQESGTRASLYRLRVRDGEPADLSLTPARAGESETWTADALDPGTLYRFSLDAVDDAGNSTTSNEVEGATLGVIACTDNDACPTGSICSAEVSACVEDEDVPPGPVVDLRVDLAGTTTTSIRLTFTAPGDDGFVPGTSAFRYRVRLDDANVDVVQDPLAAYTPESVVVDGLTPGTHYTFALEATDDAGNTSISNSADAETGGAMCPLDGDGHRRAVGAFAVTTASQLVRLLDCEEIDGSLNVDDSSCAVGSLAALSHLATITGSVSVSQNPLCPSESNTTLTALTDAGSVLVQREISSVVTYPALRSVGTISVVDNDGLVDLALPALQTIDDGDEDTVDLEIQGNHGDVAVHVATLPAIVRINIGGNPENGFRPNAGDVLLDAPALVTAVGLFARDNAGELTISADSLESVNELDVDDTVMHTFSLPALLTTSGAIYLDETELETLELPAFVHGELNIYGFTGDTISLPQLRDNTVRISGAAALTSLALPLMESGELQIDGAALLSAVELPQLVQGSVSLGPLPGLTSLEMPLFDGGELYVHDAPLLTALDLASAHTLAGLSIQVTSLTTLSAPLLESVTSSLTFANNAFTSITLPSLVSVGAPSLIPVGGQCSSSSSGTCCYAFFQILDHSALTEIHLPALVTTGVFYLMDNDALTTWDAPLLGTTYTSNVFGNPLLPQGAVDAIQACANESCN